MMLEDIEAWERREEAIAFATTILQNVPLSELECNEQYEMQDDELDFLDYLPWIIEDFPQLQSTMLAKRFIAYVKE